MSRSATDSRDLVISRLLSAPAPALWRAWADPALLEPGGALSPGKPRFWPLIFAPAGPFTP